MSTRIFVSYAREDEALVNGIVTFLKAAGFETWFDKDNLLAGQDWRKVIEREIARARLLLICMSSHSVDKNGFVQKEMRLALEQAELRPASQVYIIPVKLDDCSLPEGIGRWHVLDLMEQKASFKLLEAIGSATGEGARAPLSDHEALTAAVRDYNCPSRTTRPGQASLGQAAQELLQLIEQEQDLEKRGIVEIRKEIQPGYTHFFPRIQYGGSTSGCKTRIFREAIAQLVSAGHLYPPVENPSTDTRTYEYRLPSGGTEYVA